MMFTELYQYLLQHKQLRLPGIGTFLLERRPAAIDFPDKRIDPPVYLIGLQSTASIPSKNFFTWLASALHIPDRDAVVLFNDFAADLKKQISDGNIINWSGVGTLSKGLGGEVKFFPSLKEFIAEESVPAEKVIREKAEHMVRVGEDEKTSAQMVEMLNQPDAKRSYWWAYALTIALLAIMFIGWYFSEHGLTMSSTANAEKSVSQEAAATYKTLP